MKTRHWILYLFVWIAFFLTLFLTSCRTKTVTQDHYITDTSVSKGLDLTWQERFVAAFEQMAQAAKGDKKTAGSAIDLVLLTKIGDSFTKKVELSQLCDFITT